MRILICTSNGGQGLIAGSEALKECILEIEKDASVGIVDFPEKVKSLSRMLVNDLYNLSLRMNISLSTLYVQIGELLRFHRWGPALENKEKAREFILGEEPDIVVITSPWISKGIARALEGTRIPVCIVVLDLGEKLPSGWACSDVTKCIAPTDGALDALIRGGMDNGVLEKVGILVHPKYLRAQDTGYDEGRALVLSGREGCSNSYYATKGLLSSRMIERVDVLCGVNDSLKRKVKALEDPRIHTYGFVEDMLPFYRTCQFVISKAGSFTVAECLAMKRPLLVDATHGIMRQEIGNAQLVERTGVGKVIRNVPDILDQAELMMENPKLYASICESIKEAQGMLDPYGVAREILQEASP